MRPYSSKRSISWEVYYSEGNIVTGKDFILITGGQSTCNRLYNYISGNYDHLFRLDGTIFYKYATNDLNHCIAH